MNPAKRAPKKELPAERGGILKKLRIADALEAAIREGRIRRGGELARELGVSLAYVRLVAEEVAASPGALQVYGAGGGAGEGG